jgi:hypothetical protein
MKVEIDKRDNNANVCNKITIQAGDKDIIIFTEARIKPCNKHNIEYVLFIVKSLIMPMTNV